MFEWIGGLNSRPNIGYELWQVTIICFKLWCDHLNNEKAVCPYTKLLPFGQY